MKSRFNFVRPGENGSKSDSYCIGNGTLCFILNGWNPFLETASLHVLLFSCSLYEVCSSNFPGHIQLTQLIAQ